LGFNIFNYFAVGTQDTANFINQIKNKLIGFFGNLFSKTTSQTGNNVSTGNQSGTNIESNSSLDLKDTSTKSIDSTLQNPQEDSISTSTSQPAISNSNSINNALQNASKPPTIEADESYSSIQMSKSLGKAGWCFIGVDKNTRSCLEIGENDVCMSGDIFPTNDVCVNPNLRV